MRGGIVSRRNLPHGLVEIPADGSPIVTDGLFIGFVGQERDVGPLCREELEGGEKTVPETVWKPHVPLPVDGSGRFEGSGFRN